LPELNNHKINIIIPALNEAAVIGDVVRHLPIAADHIIVADNGSSDGTGDVARDAGTRVIRVPIAGYGRACLAGIDLAGDADIIVFMDGDGADDPADLERVIEPILSARADFVIGSRLTGEIEADALTLPQQFGNRLACFLMRTLWGGQFTDLGPFRAITRDALKNLDMSAKTYGWTVEMQVRALKAGLRCEEVPVRYRRRVGISKISGTVKGVVLAGGHILGVIAREAFTHRSKYYPKHHQ